MRSEMVVKAFELCAVQCYYEYALSLMLDETVGNGTVRREAVLCEIYF